MDIEDRDHFKTIALASAKPQTGLSMQPNVENLKLRHDQTSCLAKAKAIFACYRRDEAHDPEGFTAALTAILGDYPASIVDYAADPRTGVITEFKMGLPNIGQIKGYLDNLAEKQAKLKHYEELQKAKPMKFIPRPLKPNEIDSTMHAKLVKEGKTPMRPIGAFEPGGYLGPKT